MKYPKYNYREFLARIPSEDTDHFAIDIRALFGAIASD